MTFWDRLASGEAVRVTVPEATRKPARRVRVARTAPWSNYAGFNPRKGGRPRCRAPGCGRYLKIDQPYACSDRCGIRVRELLADLKERVEGTCHDD